MNKPSTHSLTARLDSAKRVRALGHFALRPSLDPRTNERGIRVLGKGFSYFSKNGQILPINEAVIPIENIEYSYGFGVYETIKVRNGVLYFAKEHVDRLLKSAEIIGLIHPYGKAQIKSYLEDLINKLKTESCNIKMLLIGGREPQLFIIPLAPLFPDRKLYSHGAKTITVGYERLFPNAKTLNMLPSYMAYKKAKESDCYDAICIDSEGFITEGTRTNFFAIKDSILFSPPEPKILAGVTRKTVLFVAKKYGFKVQEKDILLAEIGQYDGAFLTSTSTKIIPIRQIDDFVFGEIPVKLKELMSTYDTFLKESNGIFKE